MSESVEARIVEVRQEPQTASATAANGRVTVLVNADNVILETKFATYTDHLDYSEIAAAITEAQRSAAAKLSRKAAEPTDPARMTARTDGVPDVLVPGLTDRNVALLPSAAEPYEASIDDSMETMGVRGSVLGRAW